MTIRIDSTETITGIDIEIRHKTVVDANGIDIDYLVDWVITWPDGTIHKRRDQHAVDAARDIGAAILEMAA